MKINFKEIERNTGRKFETAQELFYYAVRTIEYLHGDNKNYKVKQYDKIDELNEIIHAITIDD